MKRSLLFNLAAGVAGLLFALGLGLSGMTRPEKVLGFLDVASGAWDPSLAFVMGGGIAVHLFANLWMKRRSAPVLGECFALPQNKNIDGKLLAGAAIFGIGWGLGGFCPGPGLVAVAGGGLDALAFVVSMTVAMGFTAKLTQARKPDAAGSASTAARPAG